MTEIPAIHECMCYNDTTQGGEALCGVITVNLAQLWIDFMVEMAQSFPFIKQFLLKGNWKYCWPI